MTTTQLIEKKCTLKFNNISDHEINKDGICEKCNQNFWEVRVENCKLTGYISFYYEN
jgi:hypothetical protein